MFTRTGLLIILASAVIATAVWAERPIQPKEDASLVLTGTVQKITTAKEKYGNDGLMTNYTAEVKVDKVFSGDGAKPGETIKVLWFHVTKPPSQPVFGASGHSYKLKSKAKAKFWLVKERNEGWTIIYNPQGVGKAKKK